MFNYLPVFVNDSGFVYILRFLLYNLRILLFHWIVDMYSILPDKDPWTNNLEFYPVWIYRK